MADITYEPNEIEKKEYYMENGLLIWKIVPDTDDPFELLDYYSKLEAQGNKAQGVSDIATEPFLAQKIFEKGMEKQQEFYMRFMSAYQLILDAEQIADSTLPYFKAETKDNNQEAVLLTAHYYFSEIKRAAHKIGVHKHPDLPALKYIAHYVLNDDPLLNMLPRASEYARNIIKIHGIFREDNRPIQEHQRQKYEDTLAVELLTNPDIFDKPEVFRTPLTTHKNTQKIINFSGTFPVNPGEQEIAYKAGLVVNSLIEENREKLERIFSQYGISQDIGIEWIQNLLTEKIKAWTKRTPHTNYPLSDYAIKQDSDKEGIKFSADTFINLLIKNHVFQKEPFSKAPRKERKSAIRQVFNSPLLLNEEAQTRRRSRLRYDHDKAGEKDIDTYSRTLKKLFEAFRISYSPDEKRFMAINPEMYTDFNKIKSFKETTSEWRWLTETQKDFLEAFREKLERDDNLHEAAEEAISKMYFHLFLTPFDPPKKAEFNRVVRNISYDVRDNKFSQVNGINRLISRTAVYVLSQHYPKRESEIQPVDFLVKQAITVIFNETEGKKYLDPDYKDIVERVTARVTELQNRFQRKYFSENYSADKKGYMKDMLDRSIQSLEFRELEK